MSETTYTFSGEESARFCRFSQALLEANVPAKIVVDGREPMTSRPVSITGAVVDVTLDGYLRYIVVRENGSDVEYWVAGSNATRSIATTQLTFILSEHASGQLLGHAKAAKLYLPYIGGIDSIEARALQKIDEIIRDRSEQGAMELLKYLDHSDRAVALEAALGLRAFVNVITRSPQLHAAAETAILAGIQKSNERDIRVSLTENLGYIGTQASADILAALVADSFQNDHVRWAAAIALGRLPSAFGAELLIPGLSSQHEWTVAATLLSLARRASASNSQQVEPIFNRFLSLDSSHVLRRYACLGLSRCSSLQASTLEFLRDVLGDPNTPFDVRGYAALALSATLHTVSLDFRGQVQRLLESLALRNIGKQLEPETVWGLEFMAELAMLLELHALSAGIHGQLAHAFSDWRSSYYLSMACYERAEAASRQGAVDEVTNLLEEATRSLPASGTLPADAREAVSFRRDLVLARQSLNSVLIRWGEAIFAEDLRILADELRKVTAVYGRYSRSPRYIEGVKRLSDRELQYIRHTRQLISVIALVVEVDATSREPEAKIPALQSRLINAIEGLRPLDTEFSKSFAGILNEVVSTALKDIAQISDFFAQIDITAADKLRSLRALLVELRSLFQRATWPLPARVCPVYGLGRGTLTVIKEDLLGDGTETKPLLYPPGTVILNVQAEILEMIPGGTTRASITCEVGGKERIEPLPVVEGPYRASFIIDQELSSAVSLKVSIALRFETRDCSQVAEALVIYLRRSK